MTAFEAGAVLLALMALLNGVDKVLDTAGFSWQRLSARWWLFLAWCILGVAFVLRLWS